MDHQNFISYCGLTCNGCPIYWATRETDQEKQKKMRKKIAEMCNEQYGLKYTDQDINDCDGCRGESGILFSGCLDCRIRHCAVFREVETCAHCPDYLCDKLQDHYKSDPTGKIWLDIIRSTL
jgi:hypothetical protein